MKNIQRLKDNFQRFIAFADTFLTLFFGEVNPKPTVVFDLPASAETQKLKTAARAFELKKGGAR